MVPLRVARDNIPFQQTELQKRLESRDHRNRRQQSRGRCSTAIQALPIRLFLFFCYAIFVTVSVRIRTCSALSLKKPSANERAFETKQASSKPTLSSSLPPSCIGRLSVGGSNQQINKDFKTRINYHVIGTSHFRCDSYKEVSALIEREKPDGVVIELDPERLLRLTLDDATVRAEKSMTEDAMGIIGERLFGGDFLAAIEASKKNDIPIFLGDEYPVETRARFLSTLFDTNSYNPQKLLMAVKSLLSTRLGRSNANGDSDIVLVDILGAFLEDSRKLLPLAATFSLPFLTLIIAVAVDATAATTTIEKASIFEQLVEILVTSTSVLFSFFASCKVYNNLIADRDAVLCQNIQRAATTTLLLQSNQLIRKRWTFGVNQSEHEDPFDAHAKSPSTAIPLFTLKNPLEHDAVRNLNLFEPRWLKMIDRLLLLKPETPDGEKRIIGCVTCANKFYSAINLADGAQTSGANPSSFVEGRYADVIFRRRGRFGELTSVTEGSRPSGARKVGARILGRESFDLSSSSTDDGSNGGISVTPEGYLTASNLVPIDDDKPIMTIESEDAPDEINIVVVVGLLHANGVLEYLSRAHGSKVTIL